MPLRDNQYLYGTMAGVRDCLNYEGKQEESDRLWRRYTKSRILEDEEELQKLWDLYV